MFKTAVIFILNNKTVLVLFQDQNSDELTIKYINISEISYFSPK